VPLRLDVRIRNSIIDCRLHGLGYRHLSRQTIRTQSSPDRPEGLTLWCCSVWSGLAQSAVPSTALFTRPPLTDQPQANGRKASIGHSLVSSVHCTALHCTALRCAALHCTALHCTALHCTALHCTALHCAALHCTALRCAAQRCTALHCTALHCTAPTQHCTAQHCTALHCTPDNA
jgi:hypothetical protein